MYKRQIISNGLTISIKVIATAVNIANADKKFPFTAVSSLPNILMPVIKRIDDTMYIIFWNAEMFSIKFIAIFS